MIFLEGKVINMEMFSVDELYREIKSKYRKIAGFRISDDDFVEVYSVDESTYRAPYAVFITSGKAMECLITNDKYSIVDAIVKKIAKFIEINAKKFSHGSRITNSAIDHVYALLETKLPAEGISIESHDRDADGRYGYELKIWILDTPVTIWYGHSNGNLYTDWMIYENI